MGTNERPTPDELKIDSANLYREETYTDLRIGSIRHLIPIKPDGSPDPERKPLFVAQTNAMTQAGLVPLDAPIDASNLQEAIEKFPEAVRTAMARLVETVRELQRQEASRIIVPKTGPGGKIQLG